MFLNILIGSEPIRSRMFKGCRILEMLLHGIYIVGIDCVVYTLVQPLRIIPIVVGGPPF
jgi:hypothetical protein